MNLAQLLTNPLFSVFSLTAAINKLPYMPGLIGGLNLFTPNPLATTVVLIEANDNTLALIPAQPRGAPADINVEGGRELVPFIVPHFPLRDTVMADSILGVRAFGTDNQLEAINQVIGARVASMGRKEDVTQEWLRLGAIKGTIITAVDRETGAPKSSIDLFSAFGVSAQPVQNWPIILTPPITEADAWGGPIRALCLSVQRAIATELGGQGFSGVVGICGATFFDAVATSPETRQTFLNTPQAASLRDSTYGSAFVYGGIRFLEYMGGVGNLAFVADDEAHFFPIGVPDLFVEAYAPADYIETVNTLALPRYAKQEIMDFDKGVMIETQMNVLPLCTRPRTLITAKAVAGT
jgi:hypothetical protein